MRQRFRPADYSYEAREIMQQGGSVRLRNLRKALCNPEIDRISYEDPPSEGLRFMWDEIHTAFFSRPAHVAETQ